MNTCSTCALWRRADTGDTSDPEIRAGGYCQSPKLGESMHMSHAPDELVYPYDEGCPEFWTGPLFGCVHRVAVA